LEHYIVRNRARGFISADANDGPRKCPRRV
jgi:hypothetical protein